MRLWKTMSKTSYKSIHLSVWNGFTSKAVYYSTGVPTLPPCSYTPPIYQGIGYNAAINIRKEKINTNVALYKKPILITDGLMQWLWDHTGKRYLDMFGGIVTVSVGHCHPRVKNAAIKQMEKLWHVTNIYLHPTIHEYAQKLTDRMPENLKVCYFCNSGSEANDMAMLLARLYTGAFDIISLKNAYHGDSPYTVGLCGINSWKHVYANGFGIHHTMNPDPYQGIWGGSHCRDSLAQTCRKCSCVPGHCHANEMYMKDFMETLDSSVPKKVAGFIAEAIQGVGGSVQLTKGYLKEAYSAIRDRGGICIADEVQTGFGRTGQYWGFQSHDVIPDIVTLAKGIGNGFPFAAVVTTAEIAASLNKALTFNTFGGNPIACAVGSAVLDVIDEEKLMENSQHVGNHLLQGLMKLRNQHEIIGDVRGKGLMIGVELVIDKELRKPLPVEAVNEIFEYTKDMGLLVGKGGRHGNVFRIKPPMCVTRSDANFCIDVLDEAIRVFMKNKK